MNYSKLEWWERFQTYYTEFPKLGLAVDLSRMNVDDTFFAAMEPQMQKAFANMAALESGAIANPDENRMVGHYWLRNPSLAPTPEIRKEIEGAVAQINEFAGKVHAENSRCWRAVQKLPFDWYWRGGAGAAIRRPRFG